MKTKIIFPLISFLLVLLTGSCEVNSERIKEDSVMNSDGTVQALIEITSGTIEKWELNKATNQIELEKIDGKPRMINYLPYPANYGMIPKTLLPKEDGGDGDPLDVIVLGPPIEKGKTIDVKIIGLMKLLDRGEQDDKLIAVSKDSHFSEISSIDQLDSNYQGVTLILKEWFSNYKGKSKMEFLGYEEKNVADELLQKAIESYSNS